MPTSLLLSPDEQVVSSITVILREMSVACDRPMDGPSAAQKLGSGRFDLVIVDCENLAAAKLIFDSCRVNKRGNLPVLIGVVDGRAGLPTAFRLGADLILTKPVARDQARNTIRAAMTRIRREDAVSASQCARSDVQAATQPDGGVRDSASSSERAERKDPADQDMAFAATAAAGAELPVTTHPQAPGPVDAVPSVPVPSLEGPSTTTLSASAPAPATGPQTKPKRKTSSGKGTAANTITLRPFPPTRPEDDPVLAELEEAEAAANQKAAVGNQQNQNNPAESEQAIKPAKNWRRLTVLFLLLLACAAFYLTWTYDPGFQALTRAEIGRILLLLGKLRK